MNTMEDKTLFTPKRIAVGVVALLSASTFGFVCGLLLAPQSGSRTRRQIQDMALDASERMEEWTEDAKETVEEFVKQSKKVVGA
ncbi:MAG: YtxH domain-containing protein [Nitrospirota bacterium]|nr:YtxH domain-containing protein [Nitrospirota bacterium]